MSLYRWRSAIAYSIEFSAAADCRQFELETLDMSGRANICGQTPRLEKLALMPSSIAALARELGQLDVDQRLERLCPRVACEFGRHGEQRLYRGTGPYAVAAEQGTCEAEVGG